MTGFKGLRNINGRPKGAVNKTTTEIREKFSVLLENNLEKFQADIDLLEPKDRIKVILELAKFIVPTLKATESTTGNEDANNPIIVNLGNGISPEEIRLIKAEIEAKY
jgi:hypothetical protein